MEFVISYFNKISVHLGKGDKISPHDDITRISPHGDITPKAGRTDKDRFTIDYKKPRKSISDSVLETELTGPIADPLNKEQERWTKGKTRIQAVLK